MTAKALFLFPRRRANSREGARTLGPVPVEVWNDGADGIVLTNAATGHAMRLGPEVDTAALLRLLRGG